MTMQNCRGQTLWQLEHPHLPKKEEDRREESAKGKTKGTCVELRETLRGKSGYSRVLCMPAGTHLWIY